MEKDSNEREGDGAMIDVVLPSVIAVVLAIIFIPLITLYVVKMYGEITKAYKAIPSVRPLVKPNGPSREELREWFDKNPDKAPPAEWYPNGDPWRGITAEEANKMLEDCEVK
jgi:hypothetical protein